MAEEKENKGQDPGKDPEKEPEKEQEPAKGGEPASEPEEAPKEEKPEKEKKEGLLMPFLYALLAGVGAFTLVMIIGIVLTFFFQPAEPSEDPAGEESAQVTLTTSPDGTETQTPQRPDVEGPDTDAEP